MEIVQSERILLCVLDTVATFMHKTTAAVAAAAALV